MTKLETTIKHINNNLFAARIENIIQYMYEDELRKAVAKVFHQMRRKILKNLKEFYSTELMVNAHLDLILAPIHELHKKYYDTIMKYKLREHRKGQVQAKRLVKRAKQYSKQYSRAYYGGAIKADTKIPMSSIIQKDELFATSDFSAEQMKNKTFVASENTLSRVDNDINQIITNSYRDGKGINDVANNIEKRFDQLETWEANRIARTEIHGSHMQGIMQGYSEMGVEYTQWAAAHDNRTRDTHVEIDGEIIPLGGVYSNGLRYPGDTSGPISEWINCRCGNIPWFCPPGMMVPPSMTRFREKDLVVTLDKWQAPEDIIESLQTEAFDESRFAKLKTNEEIADFFGYEYIPRGKYYEQANIKTFEFYDKKTDTILRFAREGDQKCLNIDFTNSGKCEYDLKEVLRIYDDAHPNLKVGLDDITFLRGDKYSPGGDAGNHSVRIFDGGISHNFSKRGISAEVEPLEHTLDHELGHIFSDSLLQSNEHSVMDDVALNIRKEFKNAGVNDKLHHQNIGLSPQKVSYYAEKNQSENFAEVTAGVSNLKRGNNYKVYGESIKRPDASRSSGFMRDKPTLQEVKFRNPNQYEYVDNLLDHPESVMKDWKAINQQRVKESRTRFNELLKEEQQVIRAKQNISGYDKYKLSNTEEKTLAELENKKSLGFKERRTYKALSDRKELNEMWNKILLEGGDPTDYFAIPGGEGVRYEKLFKKFENWIPKEVEIKPIEIKKKNLFENKESFKLNFEEKQAYKILKENSTNLSNEETLYYNQLSNKRELNIYHKKLVEKGLDNYDSKNILNYILNIRRNGIYQTSLLM